jgi:putative transposase
MKNGIYLTRAEARMDVIDYIEMFCNSYRLHSSLGYETPNDFEIEIITEKNA